MNRFLLTEDERKYLGFYLDKSNRNHTLNTINNSSTNNSSAPNYWYLDCEFVITTQGEELVIIAIGNPDTNQDYVIKVKPTNPVVDWIGHITGLDANTQWDMEFDELIGFLKTLLAQEDILIGHHLSNDLAKLNWYHENIIDTCFMYNTPDGPPTYYSLKQLAQMYLKKKIQTSTHSALEDAKTAYELVNYAYKNNYSKVNWARINETVCLDKSNIIQIITDSLGIKQEKLYCVYTRGSRAVGTSKFNSDYDLVVIVDKSAHIINGTLTRYANVDICVYDQEEFEKYLEFQYIWALECVYCPKRLVYLELINFKQIAENYRTGNPIISNDYLSRSIGYESGRKIASARKHYLNGDYHQAKKHIFIAFRFVDYGIQLVTFGKIKNLSNSNFIWVGLMGWKTNWDYEQFKLRWYQMYINNCKQLSNSIKKLNNNRNLNNKKIVNFKLYNHVSLQRNFNFELEIIKLITRKQINEFLTHCPGHVTTYNNIINLYGILKNKVLDIWKLIWESIRKSSEQTNNLVSRKDFSEILNDYTKNYHKYLFLLYDKKSIELEDLKFKPSKIYNDIITKKSSNISKSSYKPIPKKEWIEYQNSNASQVIQTDLEDFTKIRYIGGLDISFDKSDDSKACGYLSIWDCVDNKIVWEIHKVCTLTIPYVSGFLGFRELPIYKELIENLKQSQTQYFPQVLFVDGFGILHHRGFGSACQIGYELDIPTIGIGKTLLYIDGLDEFVIKTQFKNSCVKKGDWVSLIGKSGKTYGAALKTSDDSTNPLYVTIGHKISIDTSINLVIKTCLFKNPEPIRNSDIKSKLYL